MARLARLTLLFLLSLLWLQPGFGIDMADLLKPEQAFPLSVRADSPESVTATWDIAEGYYLYRSKIQFQSQAPDVELGAPVFPLGKKKLDENFGEVEIYRGKLVVTIPVQRKSDATEFLELAVTNQGCADAGVCYPPQKRLETVEFPPAQAPATGSIAALDGLTRGLKNLGLGLFQEEELLPPDEAFQYSAYVKDEKTLHVAWRIADGYYLYREKFKFELNGSDSVSLGEYTIPPGTPKVDEAFGQVHIFHDGIEFDLPLLRRVQAPSRISLTAHFQGCADRGVCYPPMQKTEAFELIAATSLAPAIVAPAEAPLSEQDSIAASLQQSSLWLTTLSFFGFGLLLAFTPCVFPMFPILSGIIVGRGHQITTRRAFLLSLSYVTASAAMYTLFGVLAGLFGSNLQAVFQNPWVIGTFSAVFVLLALSMFGLYNLEVPKVLQAKLNIESNKHRDGSLLGAGIMGALSALIVGPCVAAPLAGALIYIGQTGDAVLGGIALFSLGMGMGFPLLLLGASAGKLLPKAGPWMNITKAVFGVIMLAVAVWLLDRILPPSVTMMLWALLLIIPAIYLGAADALPQGVSGWRRLWKGIGVIMLAYGILLLIGVTSGNTNPLRPLQGLTIADSEGPDQAMRFQAVKSTENLDALLRTAGEQGKWVMLDFYADWCISCKEMEHYTFTDPAVRRVLSGIVTAQADVTANDAIDQALLKRFELIGPPAILFFGPDQRERKAYRIIGYMDPETFTRHVNRVTQL